MTTGQPIDTEAQFAGQSEPDLVAALRRFVPLSYRAPLEAATGRGWEIHTSAAAALSRVSLGLANTLQGIYIGQASGAARAAGRVQFRREDTAGALVVPVGAVVAAPGEHLFLTIEAASFADGGATSTLARVTAARAGFGYNQEPGLVAEVVRAGGVDVAAVGLRVTNPQRITGGKDPALDAHGWDRGLPRFAGETDAAYRERIRTIPDVVTPGAVSRLVGRYGEAWGVVVQWAETGAVGLDGYMGDDLYIGDTTGPGIDSIVLSRGSIFALLPDVGEVYDPNNYIGDDLYIGDDGYIGDWDLAKSQVGAGLLAALDAIKAAGIAIVVVQQGAPAGAPWWFDNFSGAGAGSAGLVAA